MPVPCAKTAELPFLAFVSNASAVGSLDQSQYMVYRGEEKMSKLKFLHQIWINQKEIALETSEATQLWKEASEIVQNMNHSHPNINEQTLYCGLLAAKAQEKWNLFLENQSN